MLLAHTLAPLAPGHTRPGDSASTPCSLLLVPEILLLPPYLLPLAPVTSWTLLLLQIVVVEADPVRVSTTPPALVIGAWLLLPVLLLLVLHQIIFGLHHCTTVETLYLVGIILLIWFWTDKTSYYKNIG